MQRNETVFVNIFLENNENITIGCTYRAPNTDLNVFNEEFLGVMEILKNSKVYMCGDYNIDLLKYESHEQSRCFVNNLYCYGFYPLIDSPTRITVNSSTLIDNIFTNTIDSPLKSGILVNDISDHLPIFTFSENCNVNKNIENKISWRFSRQTQDINMEHFMYSLENTDWNDVYKSDDVDCAYNAFAKKYYDVYNAACPMRKVKVKKHKAKPWLTKGLLNAINKKKNLYKSFIKYKTIDAEKKYKKYKNKLTSLIRAAEKLYYQEKLSLHKNDLKKTWSILNEITQRNKKSNELNNEFLLGKKTVCNSKDISDSFNNFFVNIGPTLAKKIKTIPTRSFNEFLGKNNSHSLYLQPTTEEEILNIVSKFACKTSCDNSEINMQIIKKTIIHILKPLTNIFNKSMEYGIFPNQMKVAKVIPLFKGGDKKLFSNYRPISILPQFSKVLEKLFYNRLISFISKFDILYSGQYGFRENHSTSLALIDLIEDITNSYDKNLSTVGVFIDLKKAFDTINHNILLQKLNHYGVRGICYQWIKSYLTNRQQYVSYNDTDSDFKNVVCGIPQGSILGPLLFLLYINDLSNISSKLKFILFADDTNIFYTDNDIANVFTTLNKELEHLNTWFKLNKLSLNVDKTNFMIFKSNKVQQEYSIKLMV